MLLPHPPLVIIMTGKLNAVDPALARKMGADDFVVKTSDMAVLVQSVRRIFSEKTPS
jgi:DNA-binding response OmpR family regulator